MIGKMIAWAALICCRAGTLDMPRGVCVSRDWGNIFTYRSGKRSEPLGLFRFPSPGKKDENVQKVQSPAFPVKDS